MPPGTPSQELPDYNPTPGTPAQELADANPTPGAISLGLAAPAEEVTARADVATLSVSGSLVTMELEAGDFSAYDAVGSAEIAGLSSRGIPDGIYPFQKLGADEIEITVPSVTAGDVSGLDATVRQVGGEVAYDILQGELVSGAMVLTVGEAHAWESAATDTTYLRFAGWPVETGVNAVVYAAVADNETTYTAATGSAEGDQVFSAAQVGTVYGPRRVSGVAPTLGQADYNPTPGTPSDEVG